MIKENKIIDYVNGDLSYEEASAIEKEMLKNEEVRLQVESYRELYSLIDDFPMEKPSVTVRANFDHMLQKEMGKQTKPDRVFPLKYLRNVAAVAAILVIGILVGQNWTQRNYIDSQTAALVSEMKMNINSESVSQRIEAMQVSQEVNHPEDEILKTLIYSLKSDKSPNVRLAAAEALNRYAGEDQVRTAFIQQLSSEQDPFVLIELINTLSEQKVEKAIDPLEKLTNAEDVAKFIKDEAHLGLIKIEKF